ncbi:MAG: DUF2203 family protein [Chloroflexi bacterium]|nr:MAG: DUF2203 family protein [Chloroflexota bacterium]
MRPKYFTVEEANALLPKIEPLVAKLLEKRAKVTHMRSQIPELMGDLRSNIATADTSEMMLDFVDIERLRDEIQSHGCVIKSINAGLVDFLADQNGRDVFLCWQYGEDKVSHFHDLNAGFNGRKPLSDTNLL